MSLAMSTLPGTPLYRVSSSDLSRSLRGDLVLTRTGGGESKGFRNGSMMPSVRPSGPERWLSSPPLSSSRRTDADGRTATIIGAGNLLLALPAA